MSITSYIKGFNPEKYLLPAVETYAVAIGTVRDTNGNTMADDADVYRVFNHSKKKFFGNRNGIFKRFSDYLFSFIEIGQKIKIGSDRGENGKKSVNTVNAKFGDDVTVLS